MQSFYEYIINEMPKPLKQAAIAGDVNRFKSELLNTFHTTKGNLENPGSSKYAVGAKNVIIHQADDNHTWPYMTFEVDTESETKNVEITLPNIKDISMINDFIFTVDGDQKSFGTRTNKESKRTGDIAAGVSYIIYAIKQATFGGKRAAARKAKLNQSINDMSTDELNAELARRKGDTLNVEPDPEL